MPFDVTQLADLTDAVRSEGNPRALLAPAPTLPLGLNVPPLWRDLLARNDAHRRASTMLWTGGGRVLPRTVRAIQEALQAVGLLITDSKSPSLLYIFTDNGEPFARRGYPPAETLPAVGKRLPVDLSSIYRIHDGWVDLFGGDTGPLPTAEWQILGSSEGDIDDGLLQVFSTGGNHMGFDLSQHPAQAHIVWSDGDVESVDDFWERLDSWMADELEEMDRNVP
jgi:hypothetical protein